MIPLAAVALALPSVVAVVFRGAKGLAVAAVFWVTFGVVAFLDIYSAQLALGASSLVALGVITVARPTPINDPKPPALPAGRPLTPAPAPGPIRTPGYQGRVDLEAIADEARKLAHDQGILT